MRLCPHDLCECMLSHFSCVRLFANQWTVACQALLSMGFSRKGHRSGLPCPPPGDLPNPGIEPVSFTSLATCCHSNQSAQPLPLSSSLPSFAARISQPPRSSPSFRNYHSMAMSVYFCPHPFFSLPRFLGSKSPKSSFYLTFICIYL